MKVSAVFSPYTFMRFFKGRRRRISSKASLLPAAFFGLVVLSIAAEPAAQAQTAHFAGVQTTIASGLNEAEGVAVDSSGNVYIADTYNNRVLKETFSEDSYTQSVIADEASNGLKYPFGVAVDGSGTVYIADSYNDRVLKETASGGGYTQVSIGSGFSFPKGLAVDKSGSVYIVDSGNNRVLKETPSGVHYTPTTIGIGLNGPSAVAVDGSGNVYITDTSNNRVVKETLSKGSYTQTEVVGVLSYPTGVAVDGSGNLYVANTNNNRVLKRSLAGGGSTQTTIGNGLSQPQGVGVDDNGIVYIVDTGNNRVVKVATAGIKFDSVDIGATSSSSIPLTFTFDSAGTTASPRVLTQGAPKLDFTNAGTGNCIAKPYHAGDSCTVDVVFSPKLAGVRYGAVVLDDASGTPIGTAYIYGTGIGPQLAFSPATQAAVATGLNDPYGVTVDGGGNVYIADGSDNRVIKETLAGSSYTQTTVATGLNDPFGVAVDGSGNIYIADTYNDRVLKETLAGGSYTQTTVATGLDGPVGVAVDGSGNVYIADASDNRVVKETLVGGSYIQTTVATGLYSQGIAVDGAGNVYITGAQNVVKETLSGGNYTQTEVVAGLQYPIGVAVDGRGNVYIADSFNNRVVKETLSGGSYTQTTIVSGLSYPGGVAVDGSGNVYTADSSNNRVVKENVVGPLTLSFARTPINSTSSDSPQTVTLSNNGTADLSFLVPATGMNPSVSPNFSLASGSTCPQLDTTSSAATLAPGSSCTLLLSFTPATIGNSLTGTATITGDNLNLTPTTHTVHLSGTATPATQTITFDPIPSQVVGQTVHLNASASSGLTVTFASRNPSVCAVSGAAAALLTVGTCSIVAIQSGNASYAAATPVLRRCAVSRLSSAPASFTITPFPSAETVRRGRLGALLLRLNSVDGFKGNVMVKCSGGPAKSKCFDLPKAVHLNGTAYMVSGILFPTSTKPGTYIITFTGVSGGSTYTAAVKFTVR